MIPYFGKYKNLLKIWLPIFILYYGIHEDIEIFLYSYFSNPSEYLLSLFSEKSWLASFVAFMMLIYCACYIYSQWNNKYFSCNKLFVKIFIIECLILLHHNSKCTWNIIEVGGMVDFSYAIIILLTIETIIRIARKFTNKSNEYRKNGFTTDEIDDKNIDKARKDYAEKLLMKLENVDNATESFAVAITGSWGTGKTTFLTAITNKLEQDKKIFFKYHPWDSCSTRQITNDFFVKLRSILKPIHSDLSTPITQYAEMLTFVGAPNNIQKIVDKFNKKTDTYILKEKIREALKELGEHIFILIDDLDRLGADEIFEVLKLIRNTANFPYIIFIVTLDKKYVINQLERKNIPASYLEKIFMADLALPKISLEYPIIEIIKNDIEKMTDCKKYGIENSLMFSSEDKNIIEKALNSPRNAQRFTRQLAQNIEFSSDCFSNIRELNFMDFFWLELLKYIDTSFYESLYKSPQDYFETKKHYRLHVYIYILKSNTNKNDDIKFEILKKIIPAFECVKLSTNQCAILENYDKYFFYGFKRDKISFTELYNVIVNDEVCIEEKVKQWKDERKINSLYNILMSIQTQTMKIEYVERYILLVFEIFKYVKESASIDLGEEKLRQNYDNNIIENLKRFISTYLNNGKDGFIIALACNVMLRLNNENVPTFMDCQNLKEIIKRNFNNYISMNPSIDASDIFVENSDLNKIVKYSTVAFYYHENGLNEYECYVYDELLKYFSKNKSKNRDVIENFKRLNISNEDPQELIDDEEEKLNERIYGLFGSIHNFETFINECFE